MQKFKTSWLQIIIHIGALLPLAILIWDFTQGRLTVNPIQEITLRTGKYTLVLLVLTIMVTPVNILFGIKHVVRLRRQLGLYAFMYVCLHLLSFAGLDYRFDFPLIWEDIGEKRFALAGLAAFLCLLILAITSTKRWMRRLGKNWERLHWIIYLAAALAVTHFAWQVKADIREPLIYGVVVFILLAVRMPAIRRKVSARRHSP